MSWAQIKEIDKESLVIGNHSYSHDYLTNYKFNDFVKDK